MIKEVRKSMSNYFNTLDGRIKYCDDTESKHWWKHVSAYLKHGGSGNPMIPLFIDDTVVEDPKEVADAFNEGLKKQTKQQQQKTKKQSTLDSSPILVLNFFRTNNTTHFNLGVFKVNQF